MKKALLMFWVLTMLTFATALYAAEYTPINIFFTSNLHRIYSAVVDRYGNFEEGDIWVYMTVRITGEAPRRLGVNACATMSDGTTRFFPIEMERRINIGDNLYRYRKELNGYTYIWLWQPGEPEDLIVENISVSFNRIRSNLRIVCYPVDDTQLEDDTLINIFFTSGLRRINFAVVDEDGNFNEDYNSNVMVKTTVYVDGEAPGVLTASACATMSDGTTRFFPIELERKIKIADNLYRYREWLDDYTHNWLRQDGDPEGLVVRNISVYLDGIRANLMIVRCLENNQNNLSITTKTMNTEEPYNPETYIENAFIDSAGNMYLLNDYSRDDEKNTLDISVYDRRNEDGVLSISVYERVADSEDPKLTDFEFIPTHFSTIPEENIYSIPITPKGYISWPEMGVALWEAEYYALSSLIGDGSNPLCKLLLSQLGIDSRLLNLLERNALICLLYRNMIKHLTGQGKLYDEPIPDGILNFDDRSTINVDYHYRNRYGYAIKRVAVINGKTTSETVRRIFNINYYPPTPIDCYYSASKEDCERFIKRFNKRYVCAILFNDKNYDGLPNEDIKYIKLVALERISGPEEDIWIFRGPVHRDIIAVYEDSRGEFSPDEMSVEPGDAIVGILLERFIDVETLNNLLQLILEKRKENPSDQQIRDIIERIMVDLASYYDSLIEVNDNGISSTLNDIYNHEGIYHFVLVDPESKIGMMIDRINEFMKEHKRLVNAIDSLRELRKHIPARLLSFVLRKILDSGIVPGDGNVIKAILNILQSVIGTSARGVTPLKVVGTEVPADNQEEDILRNFSITIPSNCTTYGSTEFSWAPLPAPLPQGERIKVRGKKLFD